VQSVIADHHGTIAVSSEEGRGATFKIQLPKKQAGAVAKAQAAPASGAAESERATATRD